MSTTITIEEASGKLSEIVDKLLPGDEVVITRGNHPVAKLTAATVTPSKPRVPGNCKGMITLLVDDDERLKDFSEYMP